MILKLQKCMRLDRKKISIRGGPVCTMLQNNISRIGKNTFPMREKCFSINAKQLSEHKKQLDRQLKQTFPHKKAPCIALVL